MKLTEKDIKKTQGIQGSTKAFFLDTESATKVSILAEYQSSFTQNIRPLAKLGKTVKIADASN